MNTNVPKDEGQHLQNVVKPAKMYGGPGKFGFDKSAYMDENHNLATDQSREKIHQSWKKYWDTSNQYLVEKSPPNLIRTRFLQFLYPNSVFITIMRHPIAVSLATQKWSKTSINSLFRHWIKCHETYMNDEKFLKRKYLFKYEDFVCSPHSIIKEINKLLEHEIQIKDMPIIDENVNEKYFQLWNKKYRENILLRPYASYLKKKYSDKMKKYGYSLNV